MKHLRFVLAAVAALLVQGAQAQSVCTCSGNEQVKAPTLLSALDGKTVCVPKSGGGWEWQEQHRTGGELWDYKLGTSTMDPTKLVGRWAVTGTGANSVVTHTYGAQAFEYKVCQVGASAAYGFCPTAGGATIMSTIKAGSSSCP